MLRGWGGQSNRILNEAIGTAAAGHSVALAVPFDAVLKQRAEEAGLETWDGYQFRSPGQFWKFIPDVFRLKRQIKAWKPDIIHMHGSQDTWAVMLAELLSGSNFPITIRTKHNVYEWKESVANKWLYPRIDAYVSISSETEKHILRFPGLKNKTLKRIHSVPSFDIIENAEPAKLEDEFPEITKDRFLWCGVGRLRQEKAWDITLQALARVVKEEPNVYLVICGSGSELGNLERQAAELGLDQNNLRFLGRRNDVPNVLKRASAFILASRSEGLGTSILEGLAAGLPAVSTIEGGIVDIINSGENGLLVEKEDIEGLAKAMLTLMRDKELYQKFQEVANPSVKKKFSPEVLVSRTNEYYEELLKTKG